METRSLTPFNWFSAPSRGAGADPFVSLQREMDRLFQDYGRGLDAPRARMPAPSVDVTETADAIRITAELPGISEKDVEVMVDDNVLTIRGEKREERHENGANRHLVERTYGSFARSFQLPPGYDPEKINATFDKGVLTLTLPKPTEAQNRTKKIEVKPAA